MPFINFLNLRLLYLRVDETTDLLCCNNSTLKWLIAMFYCYHLSVLNSSTPLSSPLLPTSEFRLQYTSSRRWCTELLLITEYSSFSNKLIDSWLLVFSVQILDLESWKTREWTIEEWRCFRSSGLCFGWQLLLQGNLLLSVFHNFNMRYYLFLFKK